MKKIKKGLVIFIIFVLMLLFIYFIVPYFAINKLTAKYGSEFADLYSENGFYDDIEYLKVLQYRDERADIYYLTDDRLKNKLSSLDDDHAAILYIEENHSSASIFIFGDVNGEWKFEGWDLIRSFSGTAEGVMWPYYF